MYFVVNAYDTKQKRYHVVGVSDDFKQCRVFGFCDKTNFLSALAHSKATPLNFSVVNNDIVEDCGVFTRFDKAGTVVVLCEVQNPKGVIDYVVLAYKGTPAQPYITRITEKTILVKEEQYGEHRHFVQNAMVRNGAVTCYPNKPFTLIKEAREHKPFKDYSVATATTAAHTKPHTIGDMVSAISDGTAPSPKDTINHTVYKEILEKLQEEMIRELSNKPISEEKINNICKWLLSFETLDKSLYGVSYVIKVPLTKYGYTGEKEQEFYESYCSEWLTYLDFNKEIVYTRLECVLKGFDDELGLGVCKSLGL